ncbi:MAG TPA: hypothetical protein VFX30_12895 [bacterium]|nr:hypothetical protein [bacterium]
MNFRPVPSFLAPLPPSSALIAHAGSSFDPLYSAGYQPQEGGGESKRPAPGKVTLTSRLSPSPAGAPQGAAHPLLAPASAPSPVLDDPFALHLEPQGPQAASSQAAAPEAHLIGPPQLNFGEIPAGETAREDAYVYNVHLTSRAFVSASLTGSSKMQLAYPVPDQLPPSREDRGSPSTRFHLVYQPTEAGRDEAVLKVSASWPEYAGWAPETVEIPVIGVAYLYGAEPPSAIAAERAREEDRARDEAAEKARAEALARAAEADNAVAKPYPQGHENRLEDAFDRAHDSLETLSDMQAIGIDVAAEEAASYARRVPEWSPSLLFRLAMGGLDMATYGLAGQVSQLAKAALSGPGGKTTSGAAFAADLLKRGLRKAGDAGRDAVFGRGKPGKNSGDAADPADSDDARIAFFAQQKAALIASRAERQRALRETHKALRPLLRGRHPESAAAGMNALADGMDAAAKDARRVQADDARFSWMRFLSETALGADLRNALDLPKEHEDKPRYDGLLDLDVGVDYFHPERDLKVLKARMNGVTASMARSVALIPLSQVLEKGVHVRVNLKVPELAVMPVVLVFDGNKIAFADETAAAGQTSDWLSRAGGYIGRPSPERQRLGARSLRDRLAALTLDELGLEVETDAA